MKRPSRFFGSGAIPEPGKPELLAGTPYHKGDFIGQKFEVYGILGKGGFGVVYLVYSVDAKEVCALKTFRDEYLHEDEVRKRFRREAEVWVELGRHPYLVCAYFAEEIGGRLYIPLEYIPPNEQGLNSLEGYLERQPPDLAQSLRWAIQCCHGLEYAYSHGVKAHRDLKPSNILIAPDKTAMITDFGLAGVVGESRSLSGLKLNISEGRVGLSMLTVEGAGFGTPTHMAPEQFLDASSCDERSDLYAFGVVLYQLASKGKLPFLAPLPRDGSEEEQARFWREMRRLHEREPVPRLDSPLAPLIRRCLEKDPARRYPSFAALRGELEPLLSRETGESVALPEIGELEAGEWNNKGIALSTLGRHEEAIACYERAVELDPRVAGFWSNKADSLNKIGHHEDAIACCERALEIDPRDAIAWNNKGNALNRLVRREQAIACFERAVKIDPRYGVAWSNKGNVLNRLGRHEEATVCFERALKLDPRDGFAWSNKGLALYHLGRHEQALACYDQALELDPRYQVAWNNKGLALHDLGRCEQALACYERALEIDPRDAIAWNNKGNALNRLVRREQAIACYERALELDPRYALAWSNKGVALDDLGRHEQAIACWKRALELEPERAAKLEPWIEEARRRSRR